MPASTHLITSGRQRVIAATDAAWRPPTRLISIAVAGLIRHHSTVSFPSGSSWQVTSRLFISTRPTGSIGQGSRKDLRWKRAPRQQARTFPRRMESHARHDRRTVGALPVSIGPGDPAPRKARWLLDPDHPQLRRLYDGALAKAHEHARLRARRSRRATGILTGIAQRSDRQRYWLSIDMISLVRGERNARETESAG